ncbi:MAG TPA: response regulator [Thermoanaerobaculia bacterium]
MCLDHKALVVDDDAAVRRMVQRILEREMFTVETAQDGLEALDKIRSENYSVIILDLMMPKLDGFGVLDHIQQNWPEKIGKVIVLTAVPGALKPEHNVSRVIPKPFDMREIVTQAVECHWLTEYDAGASSEAGTDAHGKTSR